MSFFIRLALAVALWAALPSALAGGEPTPGPVEDPLWVGLPPAPGVLYFDPLPGAEDGEDGDGFNPNAPAAEPGDDLENQTPDRENQ